MKILFWAERYLPDMGGVEVFGAQIMRTLAKRGHTFSVITCKSDRAMAAEETVDGIPVYRFSFQPPLQRKDLFGIKRLCGEVSDLKKRIAPDVIHVNSLLPSVFYHIHTIKSPAVPTVVTIHSPPIFVEQVPPLFKRLVCEASAVTTVSQAMSRALLRVVPEVEDRTTMLYNGLEPPGVTPTPLPFTPMHVVCAGRVVEEKGFDVAVNAFRPFLDIYPNARMTIAGDGPARPRLEKLTDALGMSDSIDFPGWVDRKDMPALMNKATMVIVPSRWEEPFCLVALQAAQVARPVIATRVGGLPEVVLDGRTGMVVEAEEPRLIFEKMVELAQHQDLAEQLGQAGRERALSEFTMEQCADRYEEVFRRVVEGAPVA